MPYDPVLTTRCVREAVPDLSVDTQARLDARLGWLDAERRLQQLPQHRYWMHPVLREGSDVTEIRIERKPRRKAAAIVLLVIILVVIAAVWYWQTQVSVLPATGMGSSAAHTTVAFANAALQELV